MDEKAWLEAISRMMDEKLDPIQKEIEGLKAGQKDLRDGQKDLKAGQKNMIKRLAKIEAVQEYLIEHVDDLEQKNPA